MLQTIVRMGLLHQPQPPIQTREIIVHSGATMQMMRKMHLPPEELETVISDSTSMCAGQHGQGGEFDWDDTFVK